MTHVDWAGDRTYDPPIPFEELSESAGLFLYPSHDEFARDGEYACGRPVWKRDLL